MANQRARDAGYNFITDDYYLQEPFKIPTVSDPVPNPVVDEGIVNTNSFANSGGGGGGGDGFNPAGNAFGYGEPVSEVNVRTFNPQSNDPTGSVASAQEAYNQFGDIKDKSIYSNYADINNQIMDNRQNYGAGNTFNAAGKRIGAGQFENPYEDSIDQGSTKNFTDDEETKKGFFSNLRTRARNLGSNLPAWAQTAGKTAAASFFVPQMLPAMGLKALFKKFGSGSGSGGTYGIGGLSDDQKGFYNALSNKNALFSGQQGFKTLTGKNFNAKNYVPNQLEIYNDLSEKGYKVDDEGNITQNGKTVDFTNKAFLKNKIIESFSINKQNLINQKKRSDAFKISNTRNDPVTGTKAIQNKINKEYADQRKADGKDFSVSGPETSANSTSTSNQASSERGYQLHGGDGDGGNQNQGGDTESQTNSRDGPAYDYARGGRAGYFFGGRAGYAEGGPIYSRLGTLSSGVQSAEQQLQGINASLQKAESDLGSESPGGGSSMAGGPSFTSNFEDANNQGPGSNLLFGGSMDQASPITAPTIPGNPELLTQSGPLDSIYGGTNTPGSPVYNKGPESFGNVGPATPIGTPGQGSLTQTTDPAREAYDKLQASVREQRKINPYTRDVKYGENMTFEDFKKSYDAGTDPNQPTYSGPQLQGQLQSSGGGLGQLLGNNFGSNNFGSKIMNTRDNSNDNRSYEERVRLSQEANDAPTGIMRNDGTRANLTYKNFSGLDPTGSNKPVDKPFPNFFDINKGLGSIL